MAHWPLPSLPKMRLAGTKLAANHQYRGFGDQLYDLSGQRPSLDLNFANSKSLVDATTGQNLVTFTRASSGTFVNSAGVIQTASNDVPRFDHNPTTGESLGLLVEEQRTNSLRNNTMVGAVTGTPGTLPTNWVIAAAANLSTNVIGTGVSDGVTYIDLQIVGTSNATAYILAFEGNAQIVALQNQSWSQSLWVSRVAGSFTNISATSFNIRESNSSGSQVAANVIALAQPTVTLTRVSGTTTLSQATTAFITPGLRLTITNGAAIDITLRIGLPQLEQGAFATSVIPTTTAAATRSADVASITGASFSSWYRQDEGTVFGDFTRTASTNTQQGRVFSFSDGTNTNLLEIYQTGASNPAAQVTVTTLQAQWTTSNFTVGASTREVLGYQLNNTNTSFNGSSETTDTVCTMPIALTQARIGDRQDGVRTLNGTIRRLTYWPARLSNTTLQQVTQ